MTKKFDAVKFQRQRRRALSTKLGKMSPKDILNYFQTSPSITTKPKRSRATAHNNRSHGAHIL